MHDADRGLSLERRADGRRVLPGVGRRIFEWFWQGAREADWLRSAQLSARTAAEYPRRAKLSTDLADASLVTAEPLAEPMACELYRQAAYWTLCALTPALASECAAGYSEAVWATLDDRWLEGCAPTAEARALLRSALHAGNFVYFTSLAPREQVATRRLLRDSNAALRGQLAQARKGLRRVRAQRALRLSGLLALLVCGVIASTLLRSSIARARDLANSATWRASSAFGGGGCKSPLQECDSTDGWFFHTRVNDHDPWLEFSFDAPREVSEVVVENREDCCAERAIPLTIEVSEDHEQWRAVAQRDEAFSIWRASFPTVRARWLRLHVKRPTALHLKRVRIFS